MVQKTRNQIKKEFDLFAQKVARLETLKHELDAMNVKGFEEEAKLIRSRLKDIDAIPELERDIGVLREKIREKAEHVHHVDHEARHEHKENLALKKDSEQIKHKMAKLEKLILEKKKVSHKPSLSHQEKEYINDVPDLEKELDELKKGFYEHTHAAKVKVDSGVGVMVDSKFDDFIAGLKGELTQRLKEKELSMDSQLSAEMESQKHMFEERYRSLVDQFHKKYQDKVRMELAKEVKSNFDSMLDNKLAEERHSLVKEILSQNIKRLAQDKKKLIARLESSYRAKEQKLKSDYRREMDSSRLEMKKQQQAINSRLEKVRMARAKVSNQGRQAHKKMELAHQFLIKKEQELMKKYQNEQNNMHKTLHKHISQLSAEKNRLIALKNELKKNETVVYNLAKKRAASSFKRQQESLVDKYKSIEKMKREVAKHAEYENKTVDKIKQRLNEGIESERKIRSELKDKKTNLQGLQSKLRAREKNLENMIKQTGDARQAITQQKTLIAEEKEANRRAIIEEKSLVAQEKQKLTVMQNEVKNREQQLASIAKRKSELNRERQSIANQRRKLQKEALAQESSLAQIKKNLDNHILAEERAKKKMDLTRQQLRNKIQTVTQQEKQLNNNSARANEQRLKLNKLNKQAEERLKSVKSKQELISKNMKTRQKQLEMQFVKGQLALRLEMEKSRKEEQRSVDQIKKKYASQLANHQSNTERHFSESVNRMKKEYEDELKKRSESIRRDEKGRAEQEIKRRERQLRQKFEDEYASRIESEVRKRAADMERRKAELERHVMEQAKRLFK